ncbi:MAG TPA: restriction endonuclease subunit S [Defluviitoga tunisiensis]|nr:restriction endonuclease subunit S [Defluviitoga tunisiensis]
MAVFSVIKLSELEGAKRIDAEYYKPEYLRIDRDIKRFNNYLLNQIIVSFSSGRNLPQVPYDIKQVAYIRTQNVRPILVDKEGMTSVDPSVNKFDLLKEGDILFVRVGEGVGNSSIITPHWVDSTFSDNVIRIKIKEINPYFVIVYLNSKIGSKYLERVKKGSARSLISKENVGLIRICKPSEEVVDFCRNAVLEAQKQIIQSQIFYSQAENLLLEELGLKDFKPRYKKTYTANLSNALSAQRIDAEYFQPAYEEVIEKLRENNIELPPLRKFILNIQKGIEVGSENYQNEGKPFIRVSNLSINGFTDKDQKYISKGLYQQLRGTYEPKQGDFLLTKDATPGIAYVVKEQIEGIISSGILKLQIDDSKINKEYLALCINSLIGKMQVEKDGGGSVILHWKPDQIKKLIIPLLPLSTQQKIASLVQKSHEARRKAKELLEAAKKAVEIAIENSEEEALNYISNYEK